MKNKLTYLISLFVLIGVFVFGASVFFNSKPNNIDQKNLAGKEITFYRTPTCGCCAGHAAALKEAGATIIMNDLNEVELQEIKEQNNIPFNKQSCHTAIIDEYVVEGHVPIDAIYKLITEKPDTRGITLPGMPIGTPGMPGVQTESFIVETLEGDVFWQKDPA